MTQAARRAKPPNRPTAIPLVFDTVEHARATFQRDSFLIDNVGTELTPTLYLNLTKEFGDAPRMPLDAPLPTDDLYLIFDWIQAGGPGVCIGETSCKGSFEYYCNTVDESYDFTRTPRGPCE